MNKYNSILLLSFLYVSTVFCISDEMKELAAMLHATCVEETGVDEALITQVNTEKVMVDDEKLKCYIKCFMSQMGCISDDGEVDIEATVAVVPEEYRAMTEPIIRGCGAKSGANACESAWLSHKCFLETNPSIYMMP